MALTVGLVLVGATAGTRAETVTATVALNHAPPYRILDRVPYAGIYVDFARELARRAGLELTFKEVPFKRALVMMRRGQADLMLGPNRKPDREAYMLYLEPPLSSEPKAFCRRIDAADVDGYGDLAGRRIGVLRGASYYPRFDADATLTKLEISDYDRGLRMVAAGRLDLVVAPEMQGDFLLRNLGPQVVKSSYRPARRPSFIAVSRTSPLAARADDLSRHLDAMVEDGTVLRIIGDYR